MCGCRPTGFGTGQSFLVACPFADTNGKTRTIPVEVKSSTKQVYVRRIPKLAAQASEAEQQMTDEELRSFEEVKYGDIWDKERYLSWMYENLMAIRTVMAPNASIYVHLDWHIGAYVLRQQLRHALLLYGWRAHIQHRVSALRGELSLVGPGR